MRIFLPITILILNGSILSAQFTAGVKLNPTLGYLRSKNLKHSFEDIQKSDDKITTMKVRSRAGMQFGIGGFASYGLTKDLSVKFESSINFFNSMFTSEYIWEDLDANGDGTRYRISSEAKVKYTYVNTALVAKYYLTDVSKLFVLGGVGYSVNFRPKVISNEDSITTVFDDFSTDNRYGKTIKYSATSKMDTHLKGSFNIILAVGKSFRVFYRYFDVELRYNMPFLKSAMFTNNQNFTDNTLNNAVFSQQGREGIESLTGKKINDYRMSTINFILRYNLFKH